MADISDMAKEGATLLVMLEALASAGVGMMFRYDPEGMRWVGECGYIESSADTLFGAVQLAWSGLVQVGVKSRA